MKRNPWWLIGAALAAVLVVGGISTMATLGIGQSILDRVRSVPGGDLAAHFLLIGGMSFVATLAFVGGDRRRQPRQWRRIVLVLVVLVSFDEFLQIVLPRRTFSLRDLAANYAGILVFAVAALLLRRRAASKAPVEILTASADASRSGASK